jgi:small conductance mechanosensitive channel
MKPLIDPNRGLVCVFFVGTFLLASGLLAQSAPARPDDTPVLTDADRIARLQRSLAEATAQLGSYKQKLDDPDSEFARAEKDFAKLDKEVESQKSARRNAGEQGDSSRVSVLSAELANLESRRKLAKDRFDLAIQERKTLQEQIATLNTKIKQDEGALRRLKGEPTPTATSGPAEPSAPNTIDHAVAPKSDSSDESPTLPTVGKTNSPAEQPQGEPSPPPALPSRDISKPDTPSTPSETGPGANGATKTPLGVPPKELKEARETATEKREEARQAQETVESLVERIASLRKSIELENKLIETARQRVSIAEQNERTLDETWQRRWQEKAPENQLRELREKIGEARTRLAEARSEAGNRVARIQTLQMELTTIQADHIAALESAESKRLEAAKAQEKVQNLESPWAKANIVGWLLHHGVRIIGILAGIVVILWLASSMKSRLTRLLVGKGDHGTLEDKENRAQTLVGVSHGAFKIVVIGGGALMILTELGVSIAPLLGGAAVAGLAIAFGAQNLIRDFFHGFMILLEAQYGINDVIKLGDVSGQVEKITLRVTVLRGLDGTVHIIPNGQIASVSNLTYGWSRALFDIPVAYKEDVDRVMETLVELAKEMRRDPDYRYFILEMPEMLGVDEFADSAVIIKFFIKTRPLKQWIVKRELLRRIKNKFDELGIEIPFPHRTLFHRHESKGSPRSPDT